MMYLKWMPVIYTIGCIYSKVPDETQLLELERALSTKEIRVNQLEQQLQVWYVVIVCACVRVCMCVYA